MGSMSNSVSRFSSGPPAAYSAGVAHRDSARGCGRGHSCQPSEARQARGAAVSFESRESASLEVRTADGDTISISFDALSRASRAVFQVAAGGGSASAALASSESRVGVAVSVEGTLDADEVAEIGDLLQGLVQSARGGEAAIPSLSTGFESLDAFHFSYESQRRLAGAALL